jgi:hypothetical protein
VRIVERVDPELAERNMRYEGNEDKWYTRAVMATAIILCIVAIAVHLGVHYGWIE